MPFSKRGPVSARLLGLALLGVMFGAGALSGAAVVRATAAEPRVAADTTADDRCEEQRPKILDQLALSPDQRAEVDRILARRREQTEAFWDTAGPRLRILMDSTRAEIRTVLTPAQRAEYDRLRAERRARREAEHRARDDRN